MNVEKAKWLSKPDNRLEAIVVDVKRELENFLKKEKLDRLLFILRRSPYIFLFAFFVSLWIVDFIGEEKTKTSKGKIEKIEKDTCSKNVLSITGAKKEKLLQSNVYNIDIQIDFLVKKLWEEFNSLYKPSENPSKLLEKYLWNSVFVKYQHYWQKIKKEDLYKFSEEVFRYYVFELTSGWLNRGVIERYYLYKDYWAKIFENNLWEIVWNKRAAELVLVWFVESYFWYLNNNLIAKGPYQFTYSTWKLYWLIKRWEDLRNHPLLSAEAASKLIRDNIFRVLVYKWKVAQVKEIVKENEIYVIKKWDSLKSIWKKYWYPFEFLKAYNWLKTTKLKVWQKLLIPKFDKRISNLISDDDIYLALEMYNWGLITHLKKFPKTIEEYDTILKDLYLEYKFVIKKCWNDISCLKTKLRLVESKYFKKGYSLVFNKEWEFKTNYNELLDKVEWVIFQQFKYPWKIVAAKKFFSLIDRYMWQFNYVLVNREYILKNLSLYLPWWYKIKFKYSPYALPINIVYNGEKFDELVEKYYKEVSESYKVKFVKDRYYIVKKGDNLFNIWKRFVKPKEIRFRDFLRINHLTKKSKIYPGQKIIIPKTAVVKEKLVSKNLFRKKLERKIIYSLYKLWVLKEDVFIIYKNWREKIVYMYFVPKVNIEIASKSTKIWQNFVGD